MARNILILLLLFAFIIPSFASDDDIKVYNISVSEIEPLPKQIDLEGEKFDIDYSLYLADEKDVKFYYVDEGLPPISDFEINFLQVRIIAPAGGIKDKNILLNKLRKIAFDSNATYVRDIEIFKYGESERYSDIYGICSFGINYSDVIVENIGRAVYKLDMSTFSKNVHDKVQDYYIENDTDTIGPLVYENIKKEIVDINEKAYQDYIEIYSEYKKCELLFEVFVDTTIYQREDFYQLPEVFPLQFDNGKRLENIPRDPEYAKVKIKISIDDKGKALTKKEVEPKKEKKSKKERKQKKEKKSKKEKKQKKEKLKIKTGDRDKDISTSAIKVSDVVISSMSE
ncbi:hypothetical protein ACFL58_01295 [Elusimicrobiota bacterium]